MRLSPFQRRTALLASGGLLLVALAAFLLLRGDGTAVTTVAFSDLVRQAEAGEFVSVELHPDRIGAVREDGRRVEALAPAGFVSANPIFLPRLLERNVRVDVRGSGSQSAFSIGAFLLTLGLMLLLGYTFYRLTSGRLPSVEGETRLAGAQTGPAITFDDVAGVDEAKEEVREIVGFLKEPARFAAVGGRIPKGILLVGPPGTGKTLLARSIAGEAGVPFLFASGSDFVEMYAGVGAARVRRLFKEARRHGACIVFIDELDAVGRSRGSQSLSHEEREQTLNQLLVEMDGFAASQGIVVVAATNRPDILDRALLRPGRFDRQVTVGHPDLKGREAILKLHAGRLPLAPGTDLRAVARGTPGFSGAELANVVNEAALLAARERRATIDTVDLERARDKVLMGVERRSLVMTEEERVTTAYHEAGHAIVAAMLPDADPLHKVTIVPRGRALGVTMQLPEVDRHTHSKAYLDAQLAILMGGRIAEELFTERITNGAGNDIERATEIARRMVCEFGMSSLGPVAYRRAGSPWDDDASGGFSEATARRVDREIRGLIGKASERARGLLTDHAHVVQALATELLEVESLDADEIRAVLEGRRPRLPVAARSTAA